MRRPKYLKQFHARWMRVIKMRETLCKDGSVMCFEEIGEKLIPPCSRQAASRMYHQGKEYLAAAKSLRRK